MREDSLSFHAATTIVVPSASSASSNFGAKTWETGRNDVVISTGSTHIASQHHVRVLSVRYIQTISSVIPALPIRVWGFQNSRSAR
jgi:hypothetical protein